MSNKKSIQKSNLCDMCIVPTLQVSGEEGKPTVSKVCSLTSTVLDGSIVVSACSDYVEDLSIDFDLDGEDHTDEAAEVMEIYTCQKCNSTDIRTNDFNAGKKYGIKAHCGSCEHTWVDSENTI